MVKIIPDSWKYPEITEVEILLDDKSYRSPQFRETKWMLKSKVKFNGSYIGEISVSYTEERDEEYEGPFLEEERILLNAIAERLGRITERIRSKEKLEMEEEALKNKNIAMSEIIKQARYESRETEKRIQKNIDYIILPIVESLETEMRNTSYEYSLRLLKNSLKEIAAPLYAGLSKDFSILTPKEIQICNMISRGFSSKEIAQMRNLSPTTIHRHRENIRRKLGLTNSGTNLELFLQKYLET